MADITKIPYVSAQRLGYYDQKIKEYIKSADDAVLAASKKYTDDQAVNYDPAGTAQTKVDELANGAVKANTEAIAKLNGGSDVDGSVAKAIADAKTLIDADVDAVEGKADAAQGAADKAQADVDALKTYVGVIPETSEATDVIGYVQEKTAGIATDAALGELTGRVAEAEAAIEAIEKDYLVEADKTELQGNIDGVNAKVTTLVGDDANKSVRTIANEELVKQLIPETAKESLDTLTEIAAWIQSHPEDASAMNDAITALQNLVGTMPEGIDQTNIVAYVQSLVAAEQNRATGVEEGLDARITAVEGKFAGEGSVDSKIEDAEQAAKEYADGLNTAMDGRVAALEAVDHEHANKALLDTYTQTEADLADSVAKKHEHGNKTVLDGITDVKVAAWDASEQNAKDYAKDYADGKDAAIAAAQKAGDDAAAAVTALAEGAVADNTTDITDHEGRIAALEAVEHVEITEAEIDALFA